MMTERWIVMTLDDRLGWMLFGALLGYSLGLLQNAMTEPKLPKRDERGFTRIPIVMDIAVIVVVALTVWAAFASQQANHKVEKQQEDLIADQRHDAKITKCNRDALDQVVAALDARVGSTRMQIEANVDLVEAQQDFFQLVLSEPANDRLEFRAITRYLRQMGRFQDANREAIEDVEDVPFPTPEALDICYKQEESE